MSRGKEDSGKCKSGWEEQVVLLGGRAFLDGVEESRVTLGNFMYI